MFRSRFSRTAVSMLAATLFGVLTVVGCSDDDNNNDDGHIPDDIENPGSGSIATAMGWEWASCYEDEYDDEEWCDVIMFRPNGEMWVLDEVYGDYWIEVKDGEWAELTDNRLRLTRIYSDEGMTIDYTLSDNGNTLIFLTPDGYVGDPIVFTKRRSHRPNGGGGNLVLPAGQAWTYRDYWENEHHGIIFKSDGTVQSIDGFLGYIWTVDEEGTGTYSTSSGGILNVTFFEEGYEIEFRMNYTVSGNTLYMVDGELERTSGVVIFDGDNDALMVLCMSLVATGTVPSLEMCMSIGDIIFNKRSEETDSNKHPVFRRAQPRRALSKR